MSAKHKETVYVGLDVGSTKVRCIVGLQDGNEVEPSIIGVGVAPAVGTRKGIVVDIDETVSSITAAVEEAERISGVAIDKATISIDGAHIRSVNSRGVVAVSRADQEVTVEDLNRVEDAAVAIQLPTNCEIIQVFPRGYTLDSQQGIKDPVGMRGVRLEVESHLILGATSAIKNLDRAVYQAGILIQGQVLVPLAAARAVLTKRQKDMGVALVDIGGGTTGVAIFEEGDVLYSSVLPVGAGHITSDIGIGAKVDIEVAERVKVKYFSAAGAGKSASEIIEEFGAQEKFTIGDLHDIGLARLDEIFGLIGDELKRVGKERSLPGGIVLTGGGANTRGIAEYARERLQLPVIVGKPESYGGLANRIADPAFSTAVGLMMENIGHSAITAPSGVDIAGTVGKLKSAFKKFLP